MKERLEQALVEFHEQVEKVKDTNELMNLKSKMLGKKSELTLAYEEFKNIAATEKKNYGQILNQYKETVTKVIEQTKVKLEAAQLEQKLEGESIDVTLPGVSIPTGSLHPLTLMTHELEDYFLRMGYNVEVGPELEKADYNFTMLNIPESHPTRDDQDSFYINPEFLLRTHTSPVQIRTMLANKTKEPIRIICPGRVYRRDTDDATHTHQFNQLEGLVVGVDISIAHLIGTLENFAKYVFGHDRKIRLRPNYFPFTEPSFEIDVNCSCTADHCAVCKNSGWIEILGAGMVHPHVLENCGYDSGQYTAFAFGMGIDRIAMLKYGITDIRDLYNNDLRFLEQFKNLGGASCE